MTYNLCYCKLIVLMFGHLPARALGGRKVTDFFFDSIPVGRSSRPGFPFQMNADLQRIAQDLESAGALMTGAAMKLGKMGHVKAKDLERLRARLNTITRSLYHHGRPKTRSEH